MNFLEYFLSLIEIYLFLEFAHLQISFTDEYAGKNVSYLKKKIKIQ